MATVMRIAVITLFRTHTYSFGGKYYLQKAGGPIGLRSTCCIARLVMVWWDEELLQLMVSNNLITEEQARYKDGIRILLWSIRMGWRWTGERLEFCTAWRDEETDKGMTPLQKTTEVLESRKYNAKNRRIAKMMSKQNWFKRKNGEDQEESQRKRMKTLQVDSETVDSVEKTKYVINFIIQTGGRIMQ